jgi:hypothetical protein
VNTILGYDPSAGISDRQSEVMRLVRMLAPYAQVANIETTPGGTVRVYVEGMSERDRSILSQSLEVYVSTESPVEILEHIK